MQRLSTEDLSHVSKAFDLAVAATPDIDHFCSSSDWVLPASAALMPARESWIHHEGESFWAFMRGETEEGVRYLEPLENMWALACPVVGPRDEERIEGLARMCEAPASEWSVMALAGVTPGSEFFVGLITEFADRLRLGLGPTSSRLLVDLKGGADAFLARRSRQFRRSLQRSERDVRAAGISIVDASAEDAQTIFRRIQEVEARGWKGQDEVGITDGGMHDFYERMLPRLARRSAQRVLFAQDEGRDVAYIFGACMLNSYRGLQFSFDEDYRKFGLGNLLQLEQIRRLCDEAIATYDLGTHMDYKLRWADRAHETVTLLLMR